MGFHRYALFALLVTILESCEVHDSAACAELAESTALLQLDAQTDHRHAAAPVNASLLGQEAMRHDATASEGELQTSDAAFVQDGTSVCFQGPFEYLESCVKDKSEVVRLVFDYRRNMKIVENATCERLGFNYAWNKNDSYFGKHGVSLYLWNEKSVGSFLFGLVSDPLVAFDALLLRGFSFRNRFPECA
eukprot:TRINITY_DN33861_c0_g1_i1.p1 TRINITY_DN33861_c0_g1~~TRINITY_DN33861_c0_g1_i1.p1  ORF type:complete len:190 (+),score=24.82 TRINITY_DN33861_c0_g1_i1:84-653(+)